MAQFLSRKPTLDELIKHVRITKKWYKFGELLHLHADELDAIEELNQDRDADFKTLKMFYLWLDTNPNATRREVIEALRKDTIGESAVAEEYVKALKEEADITMLRRVIDSGLSRHFILLHDLSWQSLHYLADQMYDADFISLDIQQSPSFDNIRAELTVELNSMTAISQIEQYCNKVLSILANRGGSCAHVGQALQHDWIEDSRAECGIELQLDYTSVDRQQLQDQSSSNTLSEKLKLLDKMSEAKTLEINKLTREKKATNKDLLEKQEEIEKLTREKEDKEKGGAQANSKNLCDLLIAQQNMKSLQERLLELESQQVQEKNSYIIKLQEKNEIITTLQKQLEQSNQQISTTSDHHDLQQLHDLVQEKDSYIAQLNRRLLTVSKEKEDILQQLKVTSHQLLSLRSSQKTTGAVSYLPKLTVVLQPVQEYWEQLGLQLNIDQSILTDIRSKGDSTEQMKHLLEEWSLKGGTLRQLEEALVHLNMRHVIPGLQELKETDLSTQEKGKDSTQVSVISTDIGGTVTTKDVECQFNYLVPSLDQLEYLDGTGVHIAGKTLFFIQGECTQLLNWEEYGLRINVPHGTIPAGEICEVSIAAIVGGKFELPSGTSLVSAVYAISVSRAFLQPVQLSIQHCVSLETQEHTNYLSFVTADFYQPVLPYQFNLEQGGQFYPRDQYGSVMLSDFSLKAVVKAVFRPIRWLLGYEDDEDSTGPVNLYVCQVVYEVKSQTQWLMKFFVSLHLDALLKYIHTSLPSAEKDVHIYFKFEEENGYIELVIREDHPFPQGWNIYPHSYPTRISQVDVDTLSGQCPPHFPSCLMTVSATPSDTTVPVLQYRITLNGIKLNVINEGEAIIPEICIIRSLATSARQSVRGLENTDNGILNCEICRRTLVQCTDVIVVSHIDPIALARKLYSKEIISEDVYKIVKDKKTGDTGTDRLDYILDDLKDHVKHDTRTFMIFLDILKDDSLNQQDLADKIMSKYKELAT